MRARDAAYACARTRSPGRGLRRVHAVSITPSARTRTQRRYLLTCARAGRRTRALAACVATDRDGSGSTPRQRGKVVVSMAWRSAQKTDASQNGLFSAHGQHMYDTGGKGARLVLRKAGCRDCAACRLEIHRQTRRRGPSTRRHWLAVIQTCTSPFLCARAGVRQGAHLPGIGFWPCASIGSRTECRRTTRVPV